MKFLDPNNEDHEPYVVEDRDGFYVVRVTEKDDEQASPVFPSRHQAECYLWKLLNKGDRQ